MERDTKRKEAKLKEKRSREKKNEKKLDHIFKHSLKNACMFLSLPCDRKTKPNYQWYCGENHLVYLESTNSTEPFTMTTTTRMLWEFSDRFSDFYYIPYENSNYLITR